MKIGLKEKNLGDKAIKITLGKGEVCVLLNLKRRNLMPKRILTLLVELEDKDTNNWIWDSHKDHKSLHGVKVKIICEGDQINYFEDENECTKRGCRTLETRCKDCGRLVADRILPQLDAITGEAEGIS